MKWSSTRPQRSVPKPQGPFEVGCTDIMTGYSVDGVFMRLYYPAASHPDAPTPKWLPDKRYLEGYALYFKIWPALFCKTFPRFVGDVTIPASWNVPPLEGHPYPVVVFSHGLGGCRASYTTLCLELASNGYVVAALEHRDYSACNSFYFTKNSTPENNTVGAEESGPPDGLTKHWMLLQKVKQGKGEYEIRNKQVYKRAKECCDALDILECLNEGKTVDNLLANSSLLLALFKGLLDTDKAVVAGHSFGGATTITTLGLDKRFKVGLGLDTWMLPLKNEDFTLKKTEQPMLFINMEKFQTKSNLKIMNKMQSDQVERKIVMLKGTVHLNQCDVPFLCDRTMRWLFRAHSDLDRFVAMKLTTRLSMSFLSKHLGLRQNKEHKDYIEDHRSVLMEGIRLK